MFRSPPRKGCRGEILHCPRANSTIGMLASTTPTSCQASKQRPLFLPLQRIPLAAGISCTSKEAEHQHKIHRKQLDYQGEGRKEEEQGQEVAPHRSTPCAQRSINQQRFPRRRNSPVLPPHLNSNTAGMADRELQIQMPELSHADAGFAHGLAFSLYMGDSMWNNQSSHSNLSLFTVFELDPLSSTQTARCLHLHHLSKNTEGKSMDKIKASQIQEVKVPTLQLLKSCTNPSYFIQASLPFYLAQAALSLPGSTLSPMHQDGEDNFQRAHCHQR